MKKVLIGLALCLGMSGAAMAAGGGIPLEQAPKRTNDMAALQNGAKIFVNYCLNCHSAAFMRYNRLRDIGLTDKQIAENLTFATDKIGDTMKASIDPKQAKDWFGANPPDLSVIARSRSAAGQGSGADYIYTYLRTYYRDDTKATGWNNLAFPNVGMPHVLHEADVALFPNRAEGGTNLVAMECLASGIPTILSANTGHLDLLRGDRIAHRVALEVTHMGFSRRVREHLQDVGAGLGWVELGAVAGRRRRGRAEPGVGDQQRAALHRLCHRRAARPCRAEGRRADRCRGREPVRPALCRASVRL